MLPLRTDVAEEHATLSDEASFRCVSLLKIQFGAFEGRDKQRAASPILRGSTFIAMMQAANFREGNNVIAC